MFQGESVKQAKILATVVLALAMLQSGCTATKAIWAMNKSTADFHALKSDPRVKYESGAENIAKVVSANLDQAINLIEARQYDAFAKPVII